MVPVTLQSRAACLKIHISVVGKIHAVGLVRRIIEQSAHKAKSLLLIQDVDFNEVAKLHSKTVGFAQKLLPGAFEVHIKDGHLALGVKCSAKRVSRSGCPGCETVS